MRRTCFSLILAAAGSVFFGAASAQSLPKGLLFGFAGGTQKLVSYDKRSGLGLGLEGMLGSRLSSRLGAGLTLGYATLPFNFAGFTPTGARQTLTLKSSLLYGNLLLDYEILNTGKVHPYVMLGAGGFSYEGFKPRGQNSPTKRFNDAAAIMGAGLRYMVSPTVALNINGAFHYTTSQNLDTQKGGRDTFASARFGITKFLGRTAMDSPLDETFGVLEQFDEGEAGQSPLEALESEGDLEGRLAELEGAPAADGSDQADMQEYIRLKSLVEEINQAISSKENEISSLQTALVSKREQAMTLERDTKKKPKAAAAPLPSPTAGTSSFSRAYEDALASFHRKQYAEAVEKFSLLLSQFPNHSLASNCYYWRGEAQYRAESYQAAIADFERVLEFPKSLKRDDALLMLGQCYTRLNRREDARQAFNRLIQEFPRSEFVAQAVALREKI